jgi:hypothetical protein
MIVAMNSPPVASVAYALGRRVASAILMLTEEGMQAGID